MSSPDSTESSVVEASPSKAESFPVAEIREAAAVGGILRHSKMWWVTLACVLLAAWLTWKSRPNTGPQISIRFPEGHGLKAGDVVRYRGIEVGVVTAVSLSENLAGITVDVMLTPGGGNLDREGTRFWIVRPRLSLTEISGLETAVGAKYIGVSPGDPGAARQKQFDGLTAAPPDELAVGGLELILRSDDRHGLSAGAPITWRGVTVGQVLSVNLSPDARHVDFGVRIERSFRRLVRPSSKFWINSGFGLDVGLTGIKLNAQSLQTIVQGGISLITPAGNSDQQISSGQVFRLADAAQKEWLESAATVPFIDLALPETVTVEGRRTTSILGIRRDRPFLQQGLLVNSNGSSHLLTAVLPTVTPDGSEDALLSDIRIQNVNGTSSEITGVASSACHSFHDGTMMVPAPDIQASVTKNDFRQPSGPEECLAVRSAVTDGKATPVIQTIDPEMLEDRQQSWAISGSDADFSQWHGAPVVAVSDGKIIGLLLSDSAGTVVAVYRTEGTNE